MIGWASDPERRMNNHILGIDHVMVTVGDLDVARNFYEGILGLKEIDCPVKRWQEGLVQDWRPTAPCQFTREIPQSWIWTFRYSD